MPLVRINETISRTQLISVWGRRHRLALSGALKTVEGYWQEHLNLVLFIQLFVYVLWDLTQDLAHRPSSTLYCIMSLL